MDAFTVDMLRQLNSRFYRACAASFSNTRQAPWEGWRACLPYLEDAGRPSAGGALRPCSGRSAQPRPGRPIPLRPEEGTLSFPLREAPPSVEGRAPSFPEKETPATRLSVVDLACGNGRFGTFLSDELPRVALDVLAVDECDELAAAGGLAGQGVSVAAAAASTSVPPSGVSVSPAVAAPLPAPRSFRFRRFDAIDALVRGASFSQELGCPPADAAVSFGFFHHIPSAALRERALRELLGLVRPGGIVIVSLWCFLEDGRLGRKAERSHGEALSALAPAMRERGSDLAAELEAGDRFLGWQDEPGVWRYCHSFSDAEADALAASVADGAGEIARFRADGKTGKLNIYLAFRKH